MSIPVLDYNDLSSPNLRPQFILTLRHALINVGFFYLSNPPDPLPALTSSLVSHIPSLFALPQEAKDAIQMENSPHFLGYSRLGKEFTKGQIDMREQFDIATEHETRWMSRADPDYWRLWGPSQWPAEDDIPGFRGTMTAYLAHVEKLSYEVTRLISEALGLGPNGLDAFYDTPRNMQHRGKIVQYPIQSNENEQGVGPHYDAGFLTFLLQASPHKGLQIQTLSGEWIDAAPIPNTFVINIGKALEFTTQGIARATSHRVLSPTDKSLGPRYSVPFFQNIGLDVRVGEIGRGLIFPEEILKLRDARGYVAPTECRASPIFLLPGLIALAVNFTEFAEEPSGRVNLIGRVKSHPETAQRHYPELFQNIFPNGAPVRLSAY